MTNAEKLSRLERIFQEILDQPDLRLTADFSTTNCPDWDSVAWVQIALAVEEEFKIRLPVQTVAHLRTVRELLDLIP